MEPDRLEYPCSFPIKVFVKPDAAAEARVEALVRAELAEGASLQVQRKLSAAGRYACLTLTFTATDAEQVQRIGSAVNNASGVLMSI